MRFAQSYPFRNENECIKTTTNKDNLWQIIVRFVDKIRQKTLQELYTRR